MLEYTLGERCGHWVWGCRGVINGEGNGGSRVMNLGGPKPERGAR